MTQDQIDRIKRIVASPNLIAGIHNYCDRWCERCPYTERCSVFAMEQTEDGESESRDIENKAFWEKLHGSYNAAIALLQEMAAEHDIDLDAPITAAELAEQKRVQQECSAHPFVSAAKNYMMEVHDWLETADALFREKTEEINLKARLVLPGCASASEGMDVKDSVEVIEWYHTLICTKVDRAVHQKLIDRPVCLEDLPSDSDGSAKVALIAIDRSVLAWTRMREHFPEREREILDFLVDLERLRRVIECEFPQARAFIRPGFDEN